MTARNTLRHSSRRIKGETEKVLCTVLALATLVTTNCSALGGLGSGASAPGAALASEKERVSPDVPEADVRELVEGNSAFAFDLYRRLAEQAGDENLFCSPYSISLALVMAYAGARGETEEQMATALRFTLPQDRLHPAFNALDQELTQRGEEEDQADKEDAEGFRLRIVNAIWGQEGGEFLDAFLDTLAVSYGAGLRLLDFAGAPEEARAKINAWVSQQTEGKIKDLIGPLNPPPRLILTNAIYFKAAWDKPFEERATRERPFTRLDGSEVTVPMMHQTDAFGYAEGEGYQAVKLRYEGRSMSMVILLPERGAFEPFEEALDAERVQSIVENLGTQEVALTMPTFAFDSGFQLKEALIALGMPASFSDGADFSGMTGGRGDLSIGDVVHKAFVSVDEEGTEAAAVTATTMRQTVSEETSQPIEVTLDHPFIFFIRDEETGAVLFVGRVLHPSG